MGLFDMIWGENGYYSPARYYIIDGMFIAEKLTHKIIDILKQG